MSKNYSSDNNRQKSDRPVRKSRSKPFVKGVNTANSESTKKNEYKAKRSFTKNKDLRSTTGKPSFDKKYSENKFERGEKKAHGRPFERSYTKNKSDKPFGNKDFKRGDSDKKFPRKKFDGEGIDKEKSFDKPFKKPYTERGEKSFGNDSDKKYPRKSFDKEDKEKTFDKPYKKPFAERGEKSFRGDSDKRFPRKSFDGEKRGGEKSFDKPYKKPFATKDDSGFDKKPRRTFGADEKREYKKSFDSTEKKEYKKKEFSDEKKRVNYDEFESGKTFTQHKKNSAYEKTSFKKTAKESSDGLIRLNKYLSNSGIASRRDADVLIASGSVKVNGVPVTEMGYKIKPSDVVTYGDSKVRNERKVYLLLNKPKDYITTMDDPQERKTVMSLIATACKERIYPVGRLDRNTTGLLLFTNDGNLATKLTHPKNNIKKVYHVSLNKGLKTEDFNAIKEGIELEDGLIKADDLAYVGEGKKEIGIEVHSGRNRIVRRIFEHLGYDVLKLDRVTFAGLTKKDLPRGKHRFLTGKEISFLQMIGG